MHSAQVDAANLAARHLAGRMAPVKHDPLVPFGGLVGDRLLRKLATAGRHCQHVLPFGSDVIFWLPNVAEGALCFSCAMSSLGSLAGSDADNQCDGCGQRFPLIRRCIGQCDMQLGSLGEVLLPPLLMLFWLCSECFIEDTMRTL